ncbi:MAG: DUF560 domain-containing protein [Sphingomonas sp.]|nr:MAG: DUF560 domain-containing protein [Sphingomonas sp.]
MTTRSWSKFALAGGAACLAVGAAAQEAPAGTRLGAVDVFALAGRAVDEGRVDEALKIYDVLTRDADLEVRSEARFRKAQLLGAQKRYREAASTYRRLLDDKPQAARVRLELAAVLAQLGDEPGARRQIRLAQASGLPADVAEQVSQFSRALRSPKLLGGTFEATLAPDTNVNRGTQARTLDTVVAPLLLDSDARETSGVGVRWRASGFAKKQVSDRIALVARANGSADLYRGGRTNDILASALIGAEWRGAQDQASAAYGYSKRWYGGTSFADTKSITGEWLHQMGRVTQLTANVTRGVIRYRRNRLQDGTLYDGNLTVERALSARSGIAIGGGSTRQNAVDASYASWAYGPLAYGWRDWGQTTVFASGTVRRLVGDERNFLFTDKRKEWFASGRVGVIARRFAVRGFAPTVRVGYERNRSTISIYDYRRVFAEAGLSRTF